MGLICGVSMRFPSLPFPSGKDWLKTLWLLALVIFWGIVAIKPMEWADQAFRATGDDFFYLPVFLVFGLIFPIVSTALIHHVLWGKRSKVFPIWVPSRVSWGEAFLCYWAAVCWFFYGLIVMLIGFLILVLIILGLKQLLPPDVFDPMAAIGIEMVKAKVESWQYIDPSAPPPDESPISILLGWAFWAYCAALTFRRQRLRKAYKEQSVSNSKQ